MNLLIKSATLLAFLATSSVSASTSRSEVIYYFDSELASDPVAVLSSANSKSTGTGTVTVKSDGTVTMDIAWMIRGNDGPINEMNAVNGIHIHKGDARTNGPIVFGFCGQDPLPAFGGKCQQGWSSDSAQIATKYAGMICDMAPPAPCYKDGKSTAAEAAQALIDSPDGYYVNIHTTKSLAANGSAGALGLIRGQLRLKEESQPAGNNEYGNNEYVATSTSREMKFKSALRGGNI